MDLREVFQNSHARLVAIVALTMVVAIGLFVYGIAGGDSVHKGLTQAFYSIDDGQTWFVDDAERVSGFEHEGQLAYRVHVYRAGDGEPFVGYLERFTPEARKRVITALQDRERPGDSMELRQLYMNGQEIKKPGDPTWHRRGTPEASAVLRIAPPAGSSGPLEPVLP